MTLAPWGCRAHLGAAKPSPQAAVLSRIEVRLARVEGRLADLAVQAQMATAGRKGLAMAATATAAGTTQGSAALLDAGRAALAAGDLAQAQGHFARALNGVPDHSDAAAQALWGLADTALAQGAQSVAVHHLERLIAMQPQGGCALPAAAKLARVQQAQAAQVAAASLSPLNSAAAAPHEARRPDRP